MGENIHIEQLPTCSESLESYATAAVLYAGMFLHPSIADSVARIAQGGDARHAEIIVLTTLDKTLSYFEQTGNLRELRRWQGMYDGFEKLFMSQSQPNY